MKGGYLNLKTFQDQQLYLIKKEKNKKKKVIEILYGRNLNKCIKINSLSKKEIEKYKLK